MKTANKYLIITSQLKDEWIKTAEHKEGIRTGSRIRDGYKKLVWGLSVRVRLVDGITDKEGRKHFEGRIFGKVVKNRFLPKRVQKPYFFDSTYDGLVEGGELLTVWCSNHEDACDLKRCVICPKYAKRDIIKEARAYLISIGDLPQNCEEPYPLWLPFAILFLVGIPFILGWVAGWNANI